MSDKDKGIFNEAVILLVLSAGAYLFTYVFQRAYLDYFYVPAVFVEISLVKLCVSGSVIVSIYVIFTHMIGSLPHRAFSVAMKYLVIFMMDIFFLIFFVTFAIKSGFSWISVTFFCLSLITLTITVVELFKSKNFKEFSDYRLRVEINLREKSLSGKMFSSLPSGMDVLLLGLVLIFLIASLSGHYTATMRKSFMQITDGEQTFIVVGNYQHSLILTKVIEGDSLNTFETTGDIKLVTIDKIRSGKTVRTKVNKGIRDSANQNTWVTFNMFKQKILNLFTK